MADRSNLDATRSGLAPLTEDQIGAMSEEDITRLIRGPILLPDLAQAMVAHGYVANVQEAFGRYIGDEAPNSLKIPISAARDRVSRAGALASTPAPATPRVNRDATHIETGMAAASSMTSSHP